MSDSNTTGLPEHVLVILALDASDYQKLMFSLGHTTGELMKDNRSNSLVTEYTNLINELMEFNNKPNKVFVSTKKEE